MADKDGFQERLARIRAQQKEPPQAAPQAKAPARKPRSAQNRLALTAMFWGLGAVGMVFAFFAVSDLSAKHLTGQGAVAKVYENDTRYQKCVNDPKLRAELTAEGHTHLDAAAMLMCF